MPVEIYKVEHGERKTTCWIEAVEGKEFQVSARTSWKATAVKSVLSVDGSTYAGLLLVCRAELTFSRRRVRGYGLGREERADKKVVCRGARISPTQIRPFVFAKMALTDDADATTVSEDVLKHLGTVQLHFHRAELKGHAGMSKTSYRDRSQAVSSLPCPAEYRPCSPLRRSRLSTSAARRPLWRTRRRASCTCPFRIRGTDVAV